MPNLKDITGQRFNRLVVIAYSGLDKYGSALWECLCECGNTKILLGGVLRSGKTKSCGCLRDEKVRQRTIDKNYKHGMSGSKEYMIWCSMRQRCENKNHKDYRLYGARGIVMCERWRCFKNFIADMGKRPSSNHSIDRIDNNGNYEPGNCRWATAKEQANNNRRWAREVN